MDFFRQYSTRGYLLEKHLRDATTGESGTYDDLMAREAYVRLTGGVAGLAAAGAGANGIVKEDEMADSGALSVRRAGGGVVAVVTVLLITLL